MTETQERFVRAVLERVDASRVAEFHLFPPIRRGAVETGVAVVAVLHAPEPVASAVVEDIAADADVVVTTDVPALVVVDAASLADVAPTAPVDDFADAPDLGMAIDGDALAIAAALAQPPELDAPVDGDALTIAAAEGVAPDVDAPVDGDAITIAAAAAQHERVAAVGQSDAAADAAIVAELHAANESPAAPVVRDDERDDAPAEPLADDAAHDIAELLETPAFAGDVAAEPVVMAAPVPDVRARIVTASYRLTIKGPERGTWLVDVQEQAEAPLSAVEAVLRGVRQRSSEPADPESIPPALLQQLVTPTVALPVATPVPAAAAPVVVADAA